MISVIFNTPTQFSTHVFSLSALLHETLSRPLCRCHKSTSSASFCIFHLAQLAAMFVSCKSSNICLVMLPSLFALIGYCRHLGRDRNSCERLPTGPHIGPKMVSCAASLNYYYYWFVFARVRGREVDKKQMEREQERRGEVMYDQDRRQNRTSLVHFRCFYFTS